MSNTQIFHCVRCNSEIKVPTFTNQDKELLTVIVKTSGQPLAIDEVRRKSGLNLKESKALIMHLNESGRCLRCEKKDLIGENVICPKCKCFNLNWS